MPTSEGASRAAAARSEVFDDDLRRLPEIASVVGIVKPRLQQQRCVRSEYSSWVAR